MGKGQLLFKGEKIKKKKNKSKHAVSGGKQESQDGESGSGPIPAIPSVSITTTTSRPATADTPTVAPPTIRKGTGKITTSGSVVTGHDNTRFEKELNPGDAILCVLENGTEELRVITMRLSNASLNLSSAFSINVKVPTSFQYIRKPKDVHKERTDAQKRNAELLHEQKTHAFDLYGNEALVYREKTETGSYRIKREHLGGSGVSNTRGDLLQLRSKKTSDKYC